MEEKEARTAGSADPNQSLVKQEPGLPVPVARDDIYMEIDKVKRGIGEVPPGLISRLVDPNARKRADAIEEARLLAIESRIAHIRGMRQVIDAYIQTNVEDIKRRQKAYLVPKIADLIDQLSDRVDSSIIRMLQLYQTSADEIAAIPGLSPELRTKQIEAAYKRAESKQEILQTQQLPMIEDVTRHLRELMGT